MNLKKFSYLFNSKLLRHFLIYFGSGSITRVIPFLVLLLVTNYFSREDFGLVSNFYVLSQLFTAIVGIKMMVAFQAEYFGLTSSNKRKHASNILMIMLAIGILLIGLSFLLKDQIYSYFKLNYYWVLGALILAFSSNIFDIRSTILRLEENPKKFAIYQLANSSIGAILTILFVVFLKLNWEGRIYASLITAVIMLVISLLFLFKKGWLSGTLSIKVIKGQLRIGLPLLPQSITPFFRKGVDKLLLTKHLGLAVNGIYSFAISWSAIFGMIIEAFFATIIPNFYKKLNVMEGQLDSEIEKKKIVKNSYTGFFALILILVLGYLFLRVLIVYAFNERYHEAIDYLPFVLIEILLQTLSKYFSCFIIFVKKTTLFGTLVFFNGLMHMILSIFMIPVFGIMGALYALVIAEASKFVGTLVLANKYYPLPWLKF